MAKSDMKLFLSCLILLTLIGCGGKSSATGNYKVEVGQTGGKVTDVGKLALAGDGSFTMTVGQLDMKGTWAQEGQEVRFTTVDEGAKMLSAQKFRVVGDTLKPIGEFGPQNHWWLKKE